MAIRAWGQHKIHQKLSFLAVQVETLEITTPSGHSLSATKFYTEIPIKESMVISSATGVLQNYYSKFAHYFAANGFAVYTFDYFGIGLSEGETEQLKNNTSDLSSWGSNDQAAIVAYAKNAHPKASLTLVSHSIGGQILGFNPNYKLIDNAVLVASQSGYWNHFKGIYKVKMWLFWYFLIPVATKPFGYFPAKKLGLFENLPEKMVYEWASWGKDPSYFMRYFNRNTYFFDAFHIPMLVLSFSKDNFAPIKTVNWLASIFKNAQLTRVHHSPDKDQKDLAHFGYFKSWAEKPYWEQCLQFIRNGNYAK